MPFPCLIFHICREAIVLVWHCDQLIQVTKIVDVGMIKDDANPTAPRKGIQIDLPSWGDDIVVDVEKVGAERADDEKS